MNEIYIVCADVAERENVFKRLDLIGFKWSAGERIFEYRPKSECLYIHVYKDRKCIKYGRRNIGDIRETTGAEFMKAPVNHILR